MPGDLHPPRTGEDVAQLGKVVAFREELSQKGLVAEYGDAGCFPDIIRPHIVLVLSRMFAGAKTHQEAAEQAGQNAPESDLSVVRHRVHALADEYDQMREAMRSGPERTRAMTAIKTRMGTLALAVYPLLPELTRSGSPGRRLVAVAALQEIPSAEYLDWLAERIGGEKPFVGYHASLALLSSVRALTDTHRREVEGAITKAQDILNLLSHKDPNQIAVLAHARRELDMQP